MRRVNFSFDVDESELIDESFLKVLDDHIKSVARNHVDTLFKEVIDNKLNSILKKYVDDSWNFSHICDSMVRDELRRIITSDEVKCYMKDTINKYIPIIVDECVSSRTISLEVNKAIESFFTKLVKDSINKESK